MGEATEISYDLEATGTDISARTMKSNNRVTYPEKESGATAGYGPLLRAAMMKVRQLDAFAHNFYKDNAEKMGEWTTASHVERQSKKTAAPPATPTP